MTISISTNTMTNILVLIRGISGSGKTTCARKIQDWFEMQVIVNRYRTVAADDFFVVDGAYEFVPSEVPFAHAWCQEAVKDALSCGLSCIVHNTFTCRWEMEPYLQSAKKYGVVVQVIDLFDGGCTDEELHARNVHGVPLDTIRAMRARYEHDWEKGDPRPPWDRDIEART